VGAKGAVNPPILVCKYADVEQKRLFPRKTNYSFHQAVDSLTLAKASALELYAYNLGEDSGKIKKISLKTSRYVWASCLSRIITLQNSLISFPQSGAKSELKILPQKAKIPVCLWLALSTKPVGWGASLRAVIRGVTMGGKGHQSPIAESLWWRRMTLLPFHFKRFIQNKADSTVNKLRDLLNFLIQKLGLWITVYIAVVFCLLGFILMAMQIASQIAVNQTGGCNHRRVHFRAIHHFVQIFYEYRQDWQNGSIHPLCVCFVIIEKIVRIDPYSLFAVNACKCSAVNNLQNCSFNIYWNVWTGSAMHKSLL